MQKQTNQIIILSLKIFLLSSIFGFISRFVYKNFGVLQEINTFYYFIPFILIILIIIFKRKNRQF